MAVEFIIFTCLLFNVCLVLWLIYCNYWQAVIVIDEVGKDIEIIYHKLWSKCEDHLIMSIVLKIIQFIQQYVHEILADAACDRKYCVLLVLHFQF